MLLFLLPVVENVTIHLIYIMPEIPFGDCKIEQ